MVTGAGELRVEQQPALLLHRYRLKEAGFRLELWTRDYGRVALMARGEGRQPQRKRGAQSGLLQPFQPLMVSWGGRGSLPLLYTVESAGYLPPLTGSALLCGFYLNELLMRLTERYDPHPQLFSKTLHTLLHLESGDSLEWELRLFERTLLVEIGYCPDFEAVLSGAVAGEGEERYCYRYDDGFVPLSSAVGGCNGVVVSTTTIRTLISEQPGDEEVLSQAKRLMRYLLVRYLGPQPLQSRKMMEDQIRLRRRSVAAATPLLQMEAENQCDQIKEGRGDVRI
ncbi:MAG: DNA repair protein RecO [Gammaproteobacteria bacterium]|nr:DNA repair protein RecO [Gammaproteobacteria bacterium]